MPVLPVRRFTSVVSWRHPARVDAEEAELAHEQVVGRLEDLGDQLAVLERLELDLVVLVGLVAEAVDLVGRQAALGEQVEQLA